MLLQFSSMRVLSGSASYLQNEHFILALTIQEANMCFGTELEYKITALFSHQRKLIPVFPTP